MMSLKDRLLKKKQEMLDQMQRGRERTEQMRAEKLRRKANRLSSMKPGARRAIIEGVAMKKKPLDVMREEYSRRRFERENKKKVDE